MPTVREEVFKVKPGLFQEFLGKLRTPFLSHHLGKKEEN